MSENLIAYTAHLKDIQLLTLSANSKGLYHFDTDAFEKKSEWTCVDHVRSKNFR